MIMKGRGGIVACVESPAQLLNVIEWAAASRAELPGRRLGDGMSIMVLPPPEPAARLQLEQMTELAAEAGFALSWHEVRGGRGVAVRAVRELRSRVTTASTVIIGDPFSGFLQLVVGLTRADASRLNTLSIGIMANVSQTMFTNADAKQQTLKAIEESAQP